VGTGAATRDGRGRPPSRQRKKKRIVWYLREPPSGRRDAVSWRRPRERVANRCENSRRAGERAPNRLPPRKNKQRKGQKSKGEKKDTSHIVHEGKTLPNALQHVGGINTRRRWKGRGQSHNPRKERKSKNVKSLKKGDGLEIVYH